MVSPFGDGLKVRGVRLTRKYRDVNRQHCFPEREHHLHAKDLMQMMTFTRDPSQAQEGEDLTLMIIVPSADTLFEHRPERRCTLPNTCTVAFGDAIESRKR